MINAPLVEAANRFFSKPYKLKIIGSSSGYSDSRLAHVTDREGQSWCLRQWIDMAENDMRFIHHSLTYSRSQGFAGVPQVARTQAGESLLALDNTWFEAQEWIAGAPISNLADHTSYQRTPNMAWNLTVDERRSVATAVALFHSSTQTIQPPTKQHSLQDQISLVLHQAQSQQLLIQQALSTKDDTENRVLLSRWVELLPMVVTYLQRRIMDYPAMLQATAVVCHGDLWPNHVYFLDRAFSGFVDFGALTFTLPAVDLAQLILHFGGWHTRNEVVTTYSRHRALSFQDATILPVAAMTDLIHEGYWSLEQLCNDNLSKHEATAHWHNLRFLLPSLEALEKEAT